MGEKWSSHDDDEFLCLGKSTLYTIKKNMTAIENIYQKHQVGQPLSMRMATLHSANTVVCHK